MIEIIKSAFRNIFRKRLRSFLTISGIAIGVLSVIIISAIGETGKYTIYMEMENIGIGGLAVSANKNVSGAVIGSDELATIQNAETVSEATPLVVEYTDIGVRNFTMNCLVTSLPSMSLTIAVPVTLTVYSPASVPETLALRPETV